jgi:hypothetical protein
LTNSPRKTTSRSTLCTSTTGVSAVTVTCSCRLPTRISAGTVSVAEPEISIPVWLTVLKPARLNVSE